MSTTVVRRRQARSSSPARWRSRLGDVGGPIDKEAMRTVEFGNLWGRAHFGGKDFYGTGQQIIYPMPFSEVKDGVATLLLQLAPPHN